MKDDIVSVTKQLEHIDELEKLLEQLAHALLTSLTNSQQQSLQIHFEQFAQTITQTERVLERQLEDITKRLERLEEVCTETAKATKNYQQRARETTISELSPHE